MYCMLHSGDDVWNVEVLLGGTSYVHVVYKGKEEMIQFRMKNVEYLL